MSRCIYQGLVFAAMFFSGASDMSVPEVYIVAQISKVESANSMRTPWRFNGHVCTWYGPSTLHLSSGLLVSGWCPVDFPAPCPLLGLRRWRWLHHR